MKIKQITTYDLDGNVYKDLNAVRNAVEDQIGSIIDNLNPRLPPKQALELLNTMILHKEELVKLLTIEYEDQVGYEKATTHNILDLP